MTDIIRVNANNKVNTGSIELDKYVNNIYDNMKRGNEAAHQIAINLYHISHKKLYEVTGAKSFSDFAENYFGISKSQGTRLVKIAERFLIPSYSKYAEYSNTQLVEMLSAKDEMLPYIKVNMRAAEIRKYIKGDTTKQLEDKTEEPKTEEPKTEEPKTEEPKTEEPKTEEVKTEYEFIPRKGKTPDTVKTDNFSLFLAENGTPIEAKILNNIGLNEFTSYINTHNISIENITIKF